MNHECDLCKVTQSGGWTYRGGSWLCSKCSHIPVAVFYEDDLVGVSFVGGPYDGRRLIVSSKLLNCGYQVPVQQSPDSPKFDYITYKFDWDLNFFCLVD